MFHDLWIMLSISLIISISADHCRTKVKISKKMRTGSKGNFPQYSIRHDCKIPSPCKNMQKSGDKWTTYNIKMHCLRWLTSISMRDNVEEISRIASTCSCSLELSSALATQWIVVRHTILVWWVVRANTGSNNELWYAESGGAVNRVHENWSCNSVIDVRTGKCSLFWPLKLRIDFCFSLLATKT